MDDLETLNRLRASLSRIARELNVAATYEGLTPTQASVLGLISARGPLGMSALANLEGLNPTLLSRVVGALTELGLIRRDADPLDLRAVRVEVTSRGREIHQRIRRERGLFVGQSIDRLPPSVAATLVEAIPALEALAAELRSQNEGGTRLPG